MSIIIDYFFKDGKRGVLKDAHVGKSGFKSVKTGKYKYQAKFKFEPDRIS